MAYFRKRGCTCADKKKCKCGAKWSFTLDAGIDASTGKRKQITKSGFDSKQDAVNAAAMVQTELHQGTHIKETDMLFVDFANEWLKQYSNSGKVKESTVRVRQHEIQYLSPYLKHMKIKDITKKQYQIVLNKLKESGHADNTISGTHGTAKMIFKKAVEYDMIKINPTQFAYVPKTQLTVEDIEQQVEIPNYLEKEELAHFLKVAQEHGLEGDYEYFLTLSYTGMRVGEMVVLREPDISFKECKISVTKTLYNPNNIVEKYKLLPPKTKKSIREIDVEQIVIKAIERHLIKLKEYKMLHRDHYYEKGFIFPNTSEHPGYPNLIKLIQSRMNRLLKIAKLNNALTPHSLRHTHTSLLAEAGVPLQEIMDRLGHKDDKTTKNVYLHVTKTRKKEASKLFGQLMENTFL